jgi:hypothetical protein
MISLNFTPRTLPRVEKAKRTPVVPLEAGAGPENPPCPACGEPLFGWIDRRPGLAGPVSRCESCGLGVVGSPGDAADALAALAPSAVPLHEITGQRNSGSSESVVILSRAGFAAWVGGAGWAGLRPGSRYLFTPEAVRRLVANRDQIVKSTHWSPIKGIATMWQTILNGFTFGHNAALGALGRSAPVPAERPWQRKLDAFISAVVAIPIGLIAVFLELAAVVFRRGSAVTLRFELL